MDEFALIRQYFSDIGHVAGVEVGIGDDAAVVSMPPSTELAVATDTLVADVHFPASGAAGDVAFRALAVNVSDMAAMAAKPRWFTLALTLPAADPEWLQAFATGLGVAAQRCNVQLIGGDTTRGPLTITLQLLGELPAGQRLLRSGARADDDLFVTGCLGEAAGGLALLKASAVTTDAAKALLQRFWEPPIRTELAVQLAGQLRAAIDVSDGLLSDLGHLCAASEVGARIDLNALPLSPELLACHGQLRAVELALTGGDDYELLLAADPRHRATIEAAGCTRVGRLTAASGIHLHRDGEPAATPAMTGYRHFHGD